MACEQVNNDLVGFTCLMRCNLQQNFTVFVVHAGDSRAEIFWTAIRQVYITTCFDKFMCIDC